MKSGITVVGGEFFSALRNIFQNVDIRDDQDDRGIKSFCRPSRSETTKYISVRTTHFTSNVHMAHIFPSTFPSMNVDPRINVAASYT